MKVQTNVKAGGQRPNHNEKQSKSLTVKTNVKAGLGGWVTNNHNEKMTLSSK